LPGLAAQRVNGRATKISVRGMSPDMTTGLLNGREQVSTGDSRGVEYDQYPSELVSAATVYKTPDGSLVGQGLSGTVDIQTVRPLDFPNRNIAASYRKEKSGVGPDLKTGSGDKMSLSYIDQFANRTIGVAVGFARLDSKGATTTKFESWGTGTAKLNGAGADLPVPYNGFNAWAEQKTETRDGAMAVFQFKPNKNFSSTLDVFHSSFDSVKATKGIQMPLNDNWVGGFTYDKAGVLTSGTGPSGTFNNVRGVVRNDTESTKDTLDSLGWNSKLKVGDWTANADLATSKVVRKQAVLETTAGTAQSALGLAQLDSVAYTSGQTFTPGLDYTNRSIIKLTDVQGWGGGVGSPQAGYSKLPHMEDKLDSIRLSAKRNLPDGWLVNALDLGVNFADRSKMREYVEGRLVIANGGPLAAADMPGAGTSTVNGINIATFDPGAALGSIYNVVSKLHPDIFNKDWKVNEKVTTFYGKGDIDSTLFGLPVRGNVGMQVVNTDQSSTAYNVDRAGCTSDIVCPGKTATVGTSYTDVLPSSNLAFDLGGDQTVRVGLARQMARPTMGDMRASFSFNYDATKVSADGKTTGIYTGDGGNPNLKPFRATALDVSYEKYFGGTKGYVSIAGFYKDLSTYIVNIANPNFDFTPYKTASTVPAASNIGTFTRPFNGSGGSLSGVELTLSLPLNIVAKPLDGFGVQVSYSDTSSSVNLPTSGVPNDNITSSKIPLPGLSKQVSTLTLYYEKNGFSTRVAQRQRSAFVGEVTNALGDRQLTWIKGESVVDMQIGYEFQTGAFKGLSILAQGNNMTNAEYIRYKDVPSNFVEHSKYGKTYALGLNYKY
jgi:iron complex outermembrane receptor protein